MKWFYRLKGNIPDNFYCALEKLDSMGAGSWKDISIDVGNDKKVLVVRYDNFGGNSFYIRYLSEDSISVKIW